MGFVAIREENLEDISAAIRKKSNTTEKYKPRKMAAAILNLPEDNGTMLVTRNIVEFSNSIIMNVGNYAFYYCERLTKVYLPETVTFGNGAFSNTKISKLSSKESGNGVLYAPKIDIIGSTCFRNCSYLTTIDLDLFISIGTLAFEKCSKLDTVILRDNSNSELSNINAFNNTPIASGTGYIYVPAVQVDYYKSATNWVTYANQIRAIEDYPEITGG